MEKDGRVEDDRGDVEVLEEEDALLRGSGDVAVDVEEVVDGTTPSPPVAGEPVALVLAIEAVEKKKNRS